MRKSILSLAVAGLAAMLVTSPAHASSLVLLGTTDATGGMMIHYNHIDTSGAGGVPDGTISGYDENPGNIAYITAQESSTNSNGSAFSFAGPVLQSIFGQTTPTTQFGLDLVYQAPTYDGSGGVVVPPLAFKDNVNGNSASATTAPGGGTTAFGIDDYLGAGGPATVGNLNDNSLFRGAGITFNIDSITSSGNIYTLVISGTLVTDGFIHWYNIATPDTSLASLNLTNNLTYTATLTYDKTGDNGASQTDFYQGSVSLFATAVPLPSVSWLGVALIGGLLTKRSMLARKA